jgi:hypothetical protein
MKSARDATLGPYLGRWERVKKYKRDWISLHEDGILCFKLQASDILIVILDIGKRFFKASISKTTSSSQNIFRELSKLFIE